MPASELQTLLLAPTCDGLEAFLQHHLDVSIPLDLQPLLMCAQLTHWMRLHEHGAHHSSVTMAHVLKFVRWNPAAPLSPHHLSLAQLFRLFYTASLCHDDVLQNEFETCLVELKRYLWMDRLAHQDHEDELTSWLHKLFPLAYPGAGEAVDTAASASSSVATSLAGLESVWLHAPSIHAVAEEEEVASELQSLLDCGATQDVAVEYLAKYPLQQFIDRVQSWIDQAKEQWSIKHPKAAATKAAAAAATTPAARAKSKPASPARAVAAAATLTASSPASKSKSSSASSAWCWDDLCLTALEVESLMVPSLYAGWPQAAEDDEEDEDADMEDADTRAAWKSKRALFHAIHVQTHPDIVAFLAQRETASANHSTSSTPQARSKRKLSAMQRGAPMSIAALASPASASKSPAAAHSASRHRSTAASVSSSSPGRASLGVVTVAAAGAATSKRRRIRMVTSEDDLMLTQQHPPPTPDSPTPTSTQQKLTARQRQQQRQQQQQQDEESMEEEEGGEGEGENKHRAQTQAADADEDEEVEVVEGAAPKKSVLTQPSSVGASQSSKSARTLDSYFKPRPAPATASASKRAKH